MILIVPKSKELNDPGPVLVRVMVLPAPTPRKDTVQRESLPPANPKRVQLGGAEIVIRRELATILSLPKFPVTTFNVLLAFGPTTAGVIFRLMYGFAV